VKLNWFSPLPPASTDIAHYTTRVLPALASRAEVTLWTDQEDWDAALKRYAEVRRYSPERVPWAELNRADMSVYHIGNNPLFHGSIWQLSRAAPGLVVLHDMRLHHFFDGLYRVKWRDLDAYQSVMCKYYGEQGRLDALECFTQEARNIDSMAERYPLTQLATENALGVLVHTREAFAQLKLERHRPAAYAPLPYEAGPRHQASQTSSEHDGGAINGPPYHLVVSGYLGRNRRLDALLKALAELPQKEQFHLDIYGQVLDDNKHLRASIRALGLKRLATIHGFVPEAELDQALARAHLAINLRYPTMGEASGSQLRIWSHALPSLVTKVGWYASLPAETVAFVRPAHEIQDIQSHLKAFLNAPGDFAMMGQRGRALLEQEHAPDAYAQAILDFAHTARRHAAHHSAYKLARRAGALMSDWIPPKSQDETFKRVATEIFTIMKDRG
jgi:glycosyltransferase involved in cell wall biosynthesis